MRKKLKPDGFTLIELVVVMAIVSTLTALATFNFNLARVRARDIQRKSELKQIQNALEIFKNDQMPQTYPTSANFATALIPAYMAKLPIDPKEKATAGSWMDYTYSQVTAATYTLEACLENSGDPDRLVPAVVCGGGSAGYIYQLTQP